MKSKKGGVRGNNKLSKALNRPIGGQLAKKKSPIFIATVLLAALAILLTFSILKLGIEDGIMFTLMLLLVGVLAYFQGNAQANRSEKD